MPTTTLNVSIYNCGNFNMMKKKVDIPIKELKAIEILNRNGVAYLLIGGYAMRFYGANRKAKDVDLLVRNSTDNAANLFAAIQEIIGHRPNFTQEDLLGELCKQVRLKNDGYEMENVNVN